MKFKKGQAVVCVDARCENPNVISPKFNEIVHIAGPGYHRKVKDIVSIVEYPKCKDGHNQAFYESQFEPLVDDAVIENELAFITELIPQ